MKQVLILLAIATTALSLGQDPANFWVTLTASKTGDSANGACHVRYMGATENPVAYGKIQLKCFHDVATPSAAHIHIGAAGSSGDNIYTLPNNGASPIIYTTPDPITKDQEDRLFKDELYVNIHTTAAPTGYARGQIMKPTAGVWYADLDNAQEGGATPPATGKVGLAWVKKNAAGTKYDSEVWHNIGNSTYGANQAHIHGPSNGPGNSTKVMYTLCSSGFACVSVTKGIKTADIDISAGDVALIKAGLTYVNVHNKIGGFAGGEIRGQLRSAMMLTQPMRAGAASTTVGVSVFVAMLLAFVARLL
jgi:hypothetical protein